MTVATEVGIVVAPSAMTMDLVGLQDDRPIEGLESILLLLLDTLLPLTVEDQGGITPGRRRLLLTHLLMAARIGGMLGALGESREALLNVLLWYC